MSQAYYNLACGANRFTGLLVPNSSTCLVVSGDFDRPTKLIPCVCAQYEQAMLCVPRDVTLWGLHPKEEVSLAFYLACRTRHQDARTKRLRQMAWRSIPPIQWAAIAAQMLQYLPYFRKVFEGEAAWNLSGNILPVSDAPDLNFELRTGLVCEQLAGKLLDYVLYLDTSTFPDDQNLLLSQSPVKPLFETAIAGYPNGLSKAEGLELVDRVEELVRAAVDKQGGEHKCLQALVSLRSALAKGRLISQNHSPPWHVSSSELGAALEFDIDVHKINSHHRQVLSLVKPGARARLVDVEDSAGSPDWQDLQIVVVPPDVSLDHRFDDGSNFLTVAGRVVRQGIARTKAGEKFKAYLAAQKVLCPD